MTVPWPPGSAQSPATAQQVLAYLGALGPWIEQAREDLDRLDHKVQETGTPAGTQDIAMTLSVWQAIKTRYDDLVRVWDSGRVTDLELRTLAAMTWGSLNDMLTPGTTLNAGAGLPISLPEACRMLEALIAQLSSRYQLAPVPTETTARIANLRAQAERIRDQAALDPPAIRQTTSAAIAALTADLTALADKADRGADVGGILGPLEVRAARLERDLIVGHAERAQLAEKAALAAKRRTALIAREQSVADLVAATRAMVTPAPKYAVPHIEALGDVPDTAAGLDAFLARLDQASTALDFVQQANQQAQGAKAALTARLEKAEAAHTGDTGTLSATLPGQIRDLLSETPARLAVIEPLITAYEAAGGAS